MGERKGTKGLELWCRRMTEGYPGVNVVNMTTSWRDGLAFCAIIHHFRPDLIEFSKLNKDDVYHNNELAFRVAERHLGIPALLEPEDMVEFPVPDRLSILTYLSQFYQAFVVAQGKSPARIASKRPATSPEHGLVSPASTSPPTKAAFPSAGKVRREPCAKCGLPVFIAERLNVGKLLYHRTCFRCARCNSQLTLANYYETENNDFCCETCPDEEKSSVYNPPDSSVLTRSLSDEEKSASLKKSEESDEYSAKFESALEYPKDDSLKRDSTLTSSQYTRARSFFISSQVGEANSDSGNEDEPPPDLPKTAPPVRDESFSDSGFPSNKHKTDSIVQSSVSLSQTSPKLEKSHDIVTKDTISAEGNASSLVKARMRLFETKSDAPNETNSVNNKVPSRISTSANKVQDSNLHSFKDNTLNKHPVESVLGANDDQTIEEVATGVDDSVITISDDNEIADTKTTDLSIITISDTTEKSTVETIDDTPSIVKSDTPEDENEEDKKQETEKEETAPIKEEPEDFSLKEQNSLEVAEPSEERPSEPPGVMPEEKAPEPLDVKPPELLEVKPPEPPEVKLPESPEVKLPVPPELKLSEPPEVRPSAPPKRGTPSVASPKKEPIQTEEEEYPDDLNPFGDEDDLTEEKSSHNASLNPFEDEEDDVPAAPSPKPASRKKITPSAADKDISRIYIERISVNPFEEDEEPEAPQPAKRKVVISPPKISLNPFWSDDEENDQDKPVPKPRFSKTGAPEARPRESGLSINSSTTFSSSSSLTSSQSGYTLRKKKPAPKPPSMLSGTESGPSSLTSSPCHSVTHSPRATPKIRKTKKAPLPPSSTPLQGSSTPPDIDAVLGEEFEKEKFAKDEQNRNRQSQNLSLHSPSSSDNSSSLGAPNKSTYGKWKRRKGQAPSRPIPQKRTIKSLPMIEVRRELEVIEIQQQGLEKQGVRLEQIIRERCEGPGVNPDESLSPEIEEMVLQLFELVNEKNELFRRQAELMYLRRQQKLEEEHADIEYQIRCLMLQPEANKTDSDKAREEELINRLVEIVERRNEIIECLEMDRVREAEEDDSINNQLNLYTLKKDEEKCAESTKVKKEKKKHKKEKKFKLKGHKVDADKDIDESESSTSSVKDKKKKKFNIF